MSKSHDSKRDAKKKPSMTIKEKRAAKKEKKEEKMTKSLLDQVRS